MEKPPSVEFYHFKVVGKPGPIWSSIKTEATPMPVSRGSLTKEKYSKVFWFIWYMKATNHYDVIIDNQEKVMWLWLPTKKPRGLLISTERTLGMVEKSEHLSLEYIAKVLKRSDLPSYKRFIIYKGEETDAFWKVLDKSSSTNRL